VHFFYAQVNTKQYCSETIFAPLIKFAPVTKTKIVH
jgi:hypothetical protein